MALLIPEPSMARIHPLGFSEPKVRFLLESTRPQAVVARDFVNTTYAVFPDRDERLARSLLSENDRTHEGALDELYVFSRLREAGYEVQYEEGGKGPDFRCYSSGQLVAGIEVASLFIKGEWEKEYRDFAKLADGVSARLKIRGFFVSLDPGNLARTPSVTKLSRFIDEWLTSLPAPAEVAARATAQGELPKTYLVDGEISIQIGALPIREGAPSLTDPHARIVGMGPTIGGMVDSANRLRGVLDSKRPSRYGWDGSPYVVVVGNHDDFCSMEEVIRALYGVDQAALEDWESLPAWRKQYASEAFFGFDASLGRRRNSRFSAIAFSEWRVWNGASGKLWLFDHPDSVNPLATGAIPVDGRLRGKAGWE